VRNNATGHRGRPYRKHPREATGLIHHDIGGLKVGDIHFACAFDVDTRKVREVLRGELETEWRHCQINTFGGNATADSTVDLYIIPATDGTNYNDGSATINPVNFYRGSWSLRAAAVFRLTIQGVLLPPVPFKLCVFNNATGQAFPATGSTVRMVGYREQFT
jgi:hypothetical protein